MGLCGLLLLLLGCWTPTGASDLDPVPVLDLTPALDPALDLTLAQDLDPALALDLDLVPNLDLDPNLDLAPDLNLAPDLELAQALAPVAPVLVPAPHLDLVPNLDLAPNLDLSPLVPVAPLVRVRHPLPVLWLMPAGQNRTAGLDQAVRMALQDLENQPEPLGNYEVQIQLLDSQCDPAAALRALFDALWAGPRRPPLLLGGVCPAVAAVLGRALPALGLVQLTFAPPPAAAGGRRPRRQLSTAPPDRALNMAALRLLQRHGWTRVGLLTQDHARLALMRKDLIRQLQKADIQLVASESFSEPEDACSGLRRLKDADVRIIVGQFEDESSAGVFCCAFRLDLFGPRYQWIWAGGGAPAGARGGAPLGGVGGGAAPCEAPSLLEAADGALRLQMRRLGSSSRPGISGRTPQGFEDALLSRLGPEGSKVSVDPLHGYAYDAVWVAAAALSRVAEAMRQREKYGNAAQRNGDHGNAVYGNGVDGEGPEAAMMLLEALRDVKLQGVTGPVSFRNGERTTSLQLLQLQGGGGVMVGELDSSSQQLRLDTQLLEFKGPGPARDRTLVLDQRRGVGLHLHAAVSTAAAATGLLGLGAGRRAAAPDRLLLLGLLLGCCSLVFSGPLWARSPDGFCWAHLWTLSLGHTLAFVGLFARTWRLYFLCTRQKEGQLTGRILLWVLLLDGFLLGLWQVLDPLRMVERNHSPEIDPSHRDAVVRPLTQACSSLQLDLWLGAACGYKAPLMVLGCFLAWRVRAAGAGGRVLTACMLALTACSLWGALGWRLTAHHPTAQFLLTSLLILSCSLFILCCLFAPKVVRMLRGEDEKDKEDEEEEEEEEEDKDEEDEEEVDRRDGDQLSILNLQLKAQSAQLDQQVESVSQQLENLENLEGNRANGVQTLTLSHAAQVCYHGDQEGGASSLGSINSPERVRRRLSVQLPILHHSYLPTVGGLSSSSSSLFGGLRPPS